MLETQTWYRKFESIEVLPFDPEQLSELKNFLGVENIHIHHYGSDRARFDLELDDGRGVLYVRPGDFLVKDKSRAVWGMMSKRHLEAEYSFLEPDPNEGKEWDTGSVFDENTIEKFKTAVKSTGVSDVFLEEIVVAVQAAGLLIREVPEAAE
jgi:hypothetical protein